MTAPGSVADSFGRLTPEGLTYDDVRDALVEIDREISGGSFSRIIAQNFAARDIGFVRAGPRLSPPDEESHFFSTRTAHPLDDIDTRRLSYRQRRRTTTHRHAAIG